MRFARRPLAHGGDQRVGRLQGRTINHLDFGAQSRQQMPRGFRQRIRT